MSYLSRVLLLLLQLSLFCELILCSLGPARINMSGRSDSTAMDDPVDWKDDKLFEPTVDMMVNDFDDEQTLEEEEKTSDPNQDQNELDNLQREGELSIEELLRLYNCPPMTAPSLDRTKPKKPRKKRKHYADATTPPPPEDDDTRRHDNKMARRLSGDGESAEKSDGNSLGATEVKLPPQQKVDNSLDDNNDTTPLARQAKDAVDPSPATLTVVDDDDDEQSSSQPMESNAGAADDEDEDEAEEEPSELVRLLDDDDVDEEEADYDYYPDEADFKKCILVGENHQAVIPDVQKSVSPSQTNDQLLWSPHSEKVNDGSVERFLSSFFKLRRHLNKNPSTTTAITVDPSPTEGIAVDQLIISSALEAATASTPVPLAGTSNNTTTTATVVKDEECALKKLLEADYNVEVALQQVCNLMHSNGGGVGISPPIGTAATTNSLGYSGTSPVSPWSEEECRNFELGIRLYGKNFPLIQQTKVGTRTVPELVQFYYFWKKTERYDSFAAKQRLEKKKHSQQNPGLTEFMDKFLEEQQQHRSLSPRQSALTSSHPSSSSASLQAKTTAQHLVGGAEQQPHHLHHGAKSPMAGSGGRESQEEMSGGGGCSGGGDGNHSLLIYADSKRHRTSGGSATTPPVVVNSGERHPLEEFAASKSALEILSSAAASSAVVVVDDSS